MPILQQFIRRQNIKPYWNTRGEITRGKKTGYISDKSKPEVKRRLKKIAKQIHRGWCLFVIDANGNICGNRVTNKCHVIPKNAVLDELKDNGGKVLELRWGVGKWQNLFLSSSEVSQIDPSNLDGLEPQPVGTGDACVRWFACKNEAKGKDHDGEFRLIDFKEPNYHDPTVRILGMYRPVLYTLDWMKAAIRLSKQENKRGSYRSNSKALIAWLKQQHILNTRRGEIEHTANRLGKMWHDWKVNRKIDCDATSWRSLTFYSRLEFSACGFYGRSVVTVVPVAEGRHKMSILYFSEDSDSLREYLNCLSKVTTESEDNSDYGVKVMEELLTNGEGTVAASPESYRGLPAELRRTTNKIVANSSRADMIETILRF